MTTEQALDLLEENVKAHREAYGLDIFPNSEKLDENSSRESISARMGRHMCDCFLKYIAEARMLAAQNSGDLRSQK